MATETKLAKIEPIEFMPSWAPKYSQALASNKSWWSRATYGDDYLLCFSIVGAVAGVIFSLIGALILISGGSGLMLGICSSIGLLSLGRLHFNARRTKKKNDKVLADANERFFFLLAQGVEAFNRRAMAWNGMLAALTLGAEDRMSREEKENIHLMLASAREELAAKVQLANGLLLPPRDHRPEVAAYLEELRDAERELPGRLAVPERALNQNGFQEVLENEVALFECAGEPKALPPKTS